MNYLGTKETKAIYNLYEFANQMMSEYPTELSLLYKDILNENIDPKEHSVSQNAGFIFDCLQTDYSGTFNNLAKSIADNSANESQRLKFGCTHTRANNYDPDATINDGGCTLNGVRGYNYSLSPENQNRNICTDINASNYGEWAPNGCEYGGTGYGYGSCQCDLYTYSPDDPCHDTCDGEGWSQGDDFCDDPSDDNYGYYGGCSGSGNGSGIGLLNTLTTIGNALWGIVEAIGIDVIYDDIVNGDQDDLSLGGQTQCASGLVYCKKNNLAGCYLQSECDTTKKERNYTWLYVTLGVVALGGVGYLIYKRTR